MPKHYSRTDVEAMRNMGGKICDLPGFVLDMLAARVWTSNHIPKRVRAAQEQIGGGR